MDYSIYSRPIGQGMMFYQMPRISKRGNSITKLEDTPTLFEDRAWPNLNKRFKAQRIGRKILRNIAALANQKAA